MIEYADVIRLLDDPERKPSKPGPGKFQTCEDARIASGLYELSLDTSNLDDQLGSVEEGMWMGWMGRFVLQQDSQGFFEYEAFASNEDAKHSFLGYGGEEDFDASSIEADPKNAQRKGQ